jgi:hypothetical protein
MTSIHNSNEQAGKHMINSQDKERHARSMHAEREELRQATGHLIRGMFRAGVSVALLPINSLPPRPRQHFHTAGREFTLGLAKLVHEFGDGLEEMVKDVNVSTHFEEDAQTDRELK